MLIAQISTIIVIGLDVLFEVFKDTNVEGLSNVCPAGEVSSLGDERVYRAHWTHFNLKANHCVGVHVSLCEPPCRGSCEHNTQAKRTTASGFTTCKRRAEK